MRSPKWPVGTIVESLLRSTLLLQTKVSKPAAVSRKGRKNLNRGLLGDIPVRVTFIARLEFKYLSYGRNNII